jgi:hypothetical protein
MLLKIANENKGPYPFLTLGDVASRQHVFQWNDQFGAYCYAPKTAQECEDICAVNWTFINFPWKVVPVFGAADVPAMVIQHGGAPGSPNRVPAGVAVAKIPPFIRPEIYANYPVDDLVLLARDCGFEPEGDREAENIKRQIASYCAGRSWANEEVRRLKTELAVRPAALPELVGPVLIAPKRGRGRPAKVPLTA